MRMNEAAQLLSEIIENKSISELSSWLSDYLTGKNIAPLPPRSRDYETSGDWLTDILSDLECEQKTKLIDANILLLKKLNETEIANESNLATDFATDVILLLEEAPATDIGSTLKLLKSIIAQDSILGSMVWRGHTSLRKYAQQAYNAQERFKAQVKS